MPTRSSLCQALLLSWFDGDAQTDAFARIVGHDARVVAAAVVVGDLVAIVARFPVVDLAALLDGLFLHAALVIVLVVDTVADDGAGNRAGSSGGRAAIAATDLATEQGAGDTADDGAASAALLRRRLHLHVFRAAFLAWRLICSTCGTTRTTLPKSSKSAA